MFAMSSAEIRQSHLESARKAHAGVRRDKAMAEREYLEHEIKEHEHHEKY
jgi:hypothetical protein